MATVYSGQHWTGNYTYTRVRVDYNYPSTTATATLLYSRTNTYAGGTGSSGETFSFGGVSVGWSKTFYGQQTDAVVASLTFPVSLSGGTYSGSGTSTFLGGSWSVTLPAHTYAISYSLNGGSSGTTTTQIKTHGKHLTLHGAASRDDSIETGHKVIFDANGGDIHGESSATTTDIYKYSFVGWKSSATGNIWSAEVINFDEDNVTTLEAQWDASITRGAITTPACSRDNETDTCTVTFNANGGSCSTTSADSTATTTYTMNGWYTAASGGDKRADNGGSYIPLENETIYAQWESSAGSYSQITLPSASKANAIASRKVNFDSNGGICLTTSLNSTSTITYAQTGWYTAASGGTKKGDAGESYSPASEETLYAQFSSTTDGFTAITLPAVARDGYKFKGWATSKDAFSGLTTTYTPSADEEVLYAIWEEISSGEGATPKVYIKINGKWVPGVQTFIKAEETWYKN